MNVTLSPVFRNSLNRCWLRLPVCYRPLMIAAVSLQILAGSALMTFDSDWRAFGATLAGAGITNLILLLNAHKKRISPTEPTPTAEHVILQAVMGTLTAVGLSFAVQVFLHIQFNIGLGPASSLALSIFMSTGGARLAGPLETWWKNRLEKPRYPKDCPTRRIEPDDK